MKLYIAIIEEVILDPEGKPTLELRIRVPNMHYGLKKEFLPIAKPLILPGVIINPEEFINQIERTTRVYVFFEQNNLNRPRYISTTDLPEFLVISNDLEIDKLSTAKVPSVKAVYDLAGNIEDALDIINSTLDAVLGV